MLLELTSPVEHLTKATSRQVLMVKRIHQHAARAHIATGARSTQLEEALI